MIDREIVNIPQFRNFAGQFDENAFRTALRNQNLTEAQLREDIARSLLQRQLLLPIAAGQRVPENVARSFANLLLERRRGTIGVVPSGALAAAINPSDAEIANYYNQNRTRFTIPERRVVRFAVIGPEQVAAASQATEQEIQAYYRQNAAQYGRASGAPCSASSCRTGPPPMRPRSSSAPAPPSIRSPRAPASRPPISPSRIRRRKTSSASPMPKSPVRHSRPTRHRAR